jgi:hypothetical protein
LRKITAALLIVILMFGTSFAGVALADPNTDKIVIKTKEESDNVVLLQMRLQDLGYFKYKLTGYFGDVTKSALVEFQKQNNLSPDGVAGENTLRLMYSNDAKRAKIVDVNPPKPKPKPRATRYGKLVDWSIVNKMWKTGMTCKVTDLDTGYVYYMKRVGGSNHADAAPINKASNATFIKTYGGEGNYPNWDRRAVVVTIGGQAIAASTNGYPHGSTGVPGNGMNLPNGHLQQVCIHFLNSHGHEHNVIDAAHQYQVRRAAHQNPGKRPALVYPGD